MTRTSARRLGRLPSSTFRRGRSGRIPQCPAPLQKADRATRRVRAFGFLCPVIIDEAEQLLAGHGRLAAAKTLGLATVPCLRVQHLTPEAKRAFALADNRLAELSDWDEDLLKVELEELAALEADLTFSLEVTGFDTVDLDRLLGPEPSPTGQETADGLSTDPDDVLPPLARQAVSRSGDLWQMGSHRALCGDALDRESYERLLQGERVTQVFTDPPYNVPVGKHVTASASFREFAMASGGRSQHRGMTCRSLDLLTYCTVAPGLARTARPRRSTRHSMTAWRSSRPVGRA